MSSILNALIGVLPLGTEEEKATWTASVTASKSLVGFISLVSMLIALCVLPMVFPKFFKKILGGAKRTYRRARKRMRRRRK